MNKAYLVLLNYSAEDGICGTNTWLFDDQEKAMAEYQSVIDHELAYYKRKYSHTFEKDIKEAFEIEQGDFGVGSSFVSPRKSWQIFLSENPLITSIVELRELDIE